VRGEVMNGDLYWKLRVEVLLLILLVEIFAVIL
jgi:hypothetical protein